jgi:hypothetical protein
MIDRDHLERILKLNGIAPHDDDEQIKSILLSARYNEDEVDTAIMVLREDRRTKRTKVDGLHKVFRTDELLNSQEISALLGVDVNLEHRVRAGRSAREISLYSHVGLTILAIILAFTALVVYMYMTDTGIFHTTSAFTISFLAR